jgi:hypothetical protein
MFASLNPSPVCEVVAIFAEGLAMNGDESRSRETEGADDSSAALESHEAMETMTNALF